MRGAVVIGIFAGIVACGGGTATTRETPLRPALDARPEPARRASEEPAPPPTTPVTEASADPETPTVDVEPADDALTCSDRRVPLSAPLCKDGRLDKLLAEFEAGERSLGDTQRCAPLTVEDLEPVEPNPGRFGDLDAGSGVFGTLDVDGDGKPDTVRHYSSVDYWAWLLFVQDKTCLRFVAAVEGYQVELLRAKHRGVRDVRVLTYPLQGRLETRKFDGKVYAR